MLQKNRKKIPIFILVIILLISSILFFLVRTQRINSISTLTNIKGVGFPKQNDHIIITEKLAHTDVFINQSVFGKQLDLIVSFIPNNIDLLDIGIRENSFWLSYPWYRLYEISTSTNSSQLISRNVIIPLTDKIKDTNGSIDLMFLATINNSNKNEYQAEEDKTNWHLYDLKISIQPNLPTKEQLKNYAKSIISGEKPI